MYRSYHRGLHGDKEADHGLEIKVADMGHICDGRLGQLNPNNSQGGGDPGLVSGEAEVIVKDHVRVVGNNHDESQGGLDRCKRGRPLLDSGIATVFSFYSPGMLCQHTHRHAQTNKQTKKPAFPSRSVHSFPSLPSLLHELNHKTQFGSQSLSFSSHSILTHTHTPSIVFVFCLVLLSC